MDINSPTCLVVIVTHNSEKFIHKAMSCLRKQTHPAEEVIIVDSGSEKTDYLNRYKYKTGIQLHLCDKDIGFCAGNNLGVAKAKGSTRYVLFINPDTFLTPNFIKWGIEYLESSEHLKVGAITGTLMGYDIEKGQPTSLYDTTGIFCTWYGRWFDRDQGMLYDPFRYAKDEEIPAACGAALLCRREALETVKRGEDQFFNPRFFMYKEDIDLSLRLKRKGWKVVFMPQLHAYHCRGWSKERTKMPRRLRLLSARNELKVQLRTFSPIAFFYSLCKYALVKCLNV